ncbi:hypothetical protein E1B28_005254 [Marasmius oreades]|uniref:Uncharacterized protein n=1 Tax=Marasmius oreades TaxID=181124 RepID=A0A9P7V0B1_9AGAR|nr:uncharacterized protein E1B28_005254 [Marasmius oreades]KAG7097943.1 hypothetical protein E1B28_005254 [Marasmius oreades]
METPTPTSTTSRPDDNAVSWVWRLLCVLGLALSLSSSYILFTPDTAVTNYRIVLIVIYVLAVLAPLFTRRDRPRQWLATCCHWFGISAHICLLYLTSPNSALKFSLLPLYIIIAFLLTAPVITCLLILVEGKFDSERLGAFGELILWMVDKLSSVYHKIVSSFLSSLHKHRYKHGFGIFHSFRRYNPPTDTEKCPNKSTWWKEKTKTEVVRLETQD